MSVQNVSQLPILGTALLCLLPAVMLILSTFIVFGWEISCMLVVTSSDRTSLFPSVFVVSSSNPDVGL